MISWSYHILRSYATDVETLNSMLYIMSIIMQFLQLHLDPASSNTLPASGDGSIKQTLRVSNSQHGKVQHMRGFKRMQIQVLNSLMCFPSM